MSKLSTLKKNYSERLIDKMTFMSEMNTVHNTLFDYKEIIQDTLVNKIEITDQGVIAHLRETNIKLHCIKNDIGIIPYSIINFGRYEETLWDKASQHINSPCTILDIGGNIGYFSLYLSNKFPKAQFHCFEPVPMTYQYLQKNIAINNNENIQAYNIGLTDKKQKIEMFFNPEGSGSSSLKNLLNNPSTYKVECEFSTLDAFVEENNISQIDFIKCDVEGAEKFVYEGGLETLKKHKPIIYSEMLRKWSAKFNYHPNDIINLLKPIGYTCYAISEDSFYPIDEVTEETIETNFLFKVEM